jgi:hypothetical protein
MISTLAQVRTRVVNLLDDPNQATFTDAIVLPAIGEAIDALQSALVFYEIPKSKVVTTYTLPQGVTNVTPATMGIANMGEVIELRERRTGSSDFYTHVYECDDLPQRPQVEILADWEWRGDSFWFVGATQSRDLWLSYFTTVEQPTAIDSTPTAADGDLSFLSLYAAGVAGPRKGYDELAAAYMQRAVGSRYDQGIIGGALFYLCQPMVRSRQRVQVAPRPYSVIRRRLMPQRGVYIAANAPAGGGGTPQQFSSANGTITGTIDGSNLTFYLPFPVTTANIYRNGLLMTTGIDCTFSANQIVFVAPQIPQVGDILTAEGWV